MKVHFIITAFVTSIIALIMQYQVVFFSLINLWISDFKTAYFVKEVKTHPDIVILKITEKTYENFPYRSPLDRKFLGRVLENLEKKEVRGVFVDILVDQKTEVVKDNYLNSVIKNFKKPLILSYALKKDRLTEKQSEYIKRFIPKEKRGLANLVKDDRDGVVREIYFSKGEEYSLASLFIKSFNIKYEKTDKNLIHWYGGLSNKEPLFKEYPIEMINKLPKNWFKEKIVLIGAKLPHLDRHKTPFISLEGLKKGVIPGIEIHAHILSQLLDSKKINVLPIFLEWVIFFILIFCSLFLGITPSLPKKILGEILLTSFYTLSVLIFWANFHIHIPLFLPMLSSLLAFSYGIFYLSRKLKAEKAFIRHAFSKYLSPKVITMLEENPQALKLGGERKELSILFTDIADFTTLSEKLPPEVLNEWLNKYLTGMSDIILNYGGTIDKFLGDGIVAFFGAPLSDESHSEKAINCLEEMIVFSNDFIKMANKENIPFGVTRMGLHLGEVVVGNFGSEGRFDYTIIGDAVNTAARLESVNKHLGTEVCVSQDVVTKFKKFSRRPIGELALKGKDTFLPVFELLEKNSEKKQYLEEYLKAFNLLKENEKTSMEVFSELHKKYPEDGLIQFHFKRLKNNEMGSSIKMEEK